MKMRLIQLTIAILTFLAFTNAAAACATGAYQPELPDILKDK